jgi:putative ABC transport system permease protein
MMGLGATFAITRTYALPFIVGFDVVLVAFGFSALVGILFGYLPARRASRLNPIDALRHE